MGKNALITRIYRCQKRPSRQAIAISVLCLAVTPTVLANDLRPTITGNTIVWDHEGWWQLENLLTREIVCQSGSECTVPDGLYWASLFYEGGGRGTRIELGNVPELQLTDEEFRDSISVNDLTMTFSVGGWHQVQDARDYSQICSGLETTCTVPDAGSYLVSHHDIGRRATVEVGGGGGNPTPTGNLPLTIDGLTISWPDDGWYQVQTADDYRTLCEGGSSCLVEPGAYIVINHTTKQRDENVVVSANTAGTPTTVVPTTDTPAVSINNAEALIAQALEVINGRAYDDRATTIGALDGQQAGLTEISRTGAAGLDASWYEVTYSCSNGGTATELVQNPGASVTRSVQTYQLCLIGSDMITGKFDYYRGEAGEEFRLFDNYEVQFANDGLMELHGRLDTRPEKSLVAAYTLAVLDYHFSYPDGRLTVTQADTYLETRAGITKFRENSGFTMTPPGESSAFDVQVGESALKLIPGDAGSQIISAGSMSIRSALDGSFLILNAQNWGTSTVDVWIQAPDGSGYTVVYPSDTWQAFFD